jgi:signal transduction histidine kinase/ligand-binding sensor domain-containing protein
MRSSRAISLVRSFCAGACLLSLTQPAGALDSIKPLTEYTRTVWTHKDGIPSAFIYSIAQTTDGYLWLATADALVRFDGVRFVHWRPKTGHTALLGPVRSLCATPDGSLWIGTAAGLVGRIRGDHLTTFPVGAQPEAILEDRAGTLWVATENRVLRFRAATGEQIGAPIALAGAFLSGLLQQSSGPIWFSTANSVVRLDPADPQVRLLEVASGKFWLSEDASEAIWMTGTDGFSQPVTEGQTFRSIGMPRKTLDVHTVLRDGKGNTWIGTLGQGLARLPAASRKVEMIERFSQADGLSNDFVWSFLEDREHNIWVATQNGLNRFREEKVTTLTRREGLISDDVDALAAGSDGSIWAATSVGLLRIDGEHRDHYLKGRKILGVHVDRNNTVWAGTSRGVTRVQGGEEQFVPMPSGIQLTDVTAIAGEDDVWFADARKGLYRWTNGRITDFSGEPLFKGKSIRTAHADHSGRGWFGLYEGGVVVFDGSRFQAYSESDGLAGGSVNAVHIDDKGTVWIAAEGGLSRLEGQRFVMWNRANGLPGERVQWILTGSDDRLWLGYSTGIASLSGSELDRAARDSSYQVAFHFLDDADGLKGNPFRRWQSPAVRARDGSLWLRTSEGVATFDPRHMAKNLVTPPVHIERLAADSADVDTSQTVRLRPLTSDVEIDYTALSLAEPRSVHFRYKLEGFDSEWRDVGARREAFYTNLRPRTYRFRVLACNNDGVWNESGASLDFTVLPAFYQTQAFLILCALFLIILSWGAYRLRVWQVTSRLRDRFEERLMERTRIAQELHDNLIQDVMGISLQIEVIDELLPLPPDLPAKQSLGRALRLCKSALDEGRRALNDLRSAPLRANDLVKSFSELSSERAGTPRMRLDVVVEGHERPLNAVAGHDVLQVGRQAIANAFQHSRARKIHVLLSYGQQQLGLRVQDNGCGMSEETMNVRRPGHYGIAGIEERANRLGGSLSIKSLVGEGTELNLSVPAQLVYQDGAPRSGSRLADVWRSVTRRLGIRRPHETHS